MRSMVGVALALSLGLVGCQGEPERGGGGGTAGERAEQARESTAERAAEAPRPAVPMGRDVSEKLAQQTHDNLRDAAKNASEARTSVAQKDWTEAKNNLDETQDKLTSIAKDIHPSMQADVTEMRTLADKAEASIKNHSANARQDLDRLVARINKLATSKVQAGGGKPAHKTDK